MLYAPKIIGYILTTTYSNHAVSLTYLYKFKFVVYSD